MGCFSITIHIEEDQRVKIECCLAAATAEGSGELVSNIIALS